MRFSVLARQSRRTLRLETDKIIINLAERSAYTGTSERTIATDGIIVTNLDIVKI